MFKYLSILIFFINIFENVSFNFSCCNDCLIQPSITGIDALDFNQCSLEKAGCCFENNCHMSLIGDFSYENMKYENNEPFILQGNYIQIRWDTIDYITFVMQVSGQNKTFQPKNNSRLVTKAVENKNWFHFCAENSGSLYFRGWKEFGCVASKEYKINIKTDANNFNCLNKPILPIDTDTNCNLNRATIRDGECVCIADFAKPPNCESYSVWKWVFIIVGVLAAIVSMIINIYNHIQNRKIRKKLSTNITEENLI